MMTPKYYSLLAVLFSLIVPAYAQVDNNYYISDNLTTILRAGASDNFRSTGTVQAGEEVVLLNVNNDSHYAQIKTSKGKVGWLPLNMIKNEASFRASVPGLQERVNELTTELDNLKKHMTSSSDDYNKEVTDNKVLIQSLQQDNQRLLAELDQNKTRLTEMESKLDDRQLDTALKWCLYGGGVAGGGLLLGLILPHLLPRRSSRDRWMN